MPHPHQKKERHDLKQKKSLSQVFLKVTWPCEKVVSKLTSWSVSHVLEVGSGKGNLTDFLLNAGFKVTAIEKDTRFSDYLLERFSSHIKTEQLQIINQDFLKCNLENWHEQLPKNSISAIVGNIPYSISSLILIKSLPMLQPIVGLIFLVQYEFAARLVARPNSKEYGSLSVFSQLRSHINLDHKVSKNCFSPVPKVDSAIVSFTPAPTKLPQDVLNSVEELTRLSFNQRRKMLRNSLKSKIKTVIDFDLNRRPETLSPQEFIALSQLLN